MTTVVQGEQFKDITGKFWEIERQLRQKKGYPFIPQDLDYFLQRAIEGRFFDLPYADERIRTDVGYPDEFCPKVPEEQAAFWLEQRFQWHLDSNHVLRLISGIEEAGLPEGAEMIAVMPKFSRLGGLYEAARRVFGFIAGSRNLFRCEQRHIIENTLRWRHTLKTAGAFQRLDQCQPGDFFGFPVQLGKRWAGASIRHARVRYGEAEFGLCPYSAGCLLMTHPGRMKKERQLYMDIGGIENIQSCSKAGSFTYYDRNFSYTDECGVSIPHALHASCTGFLPPSLA